MSSKQEKIQGMLKGGEKKTPQTNKKPYTL
jgi:hypothetical protein